MLSLQLEATMTAFELLIKTIKITEQNENRGKNNNYPDFFLKIMKCDQ